MRPLNKIRGFLQSLRETASRVMGIFSVEAPIPLRDNEALAAQMLVIKLGELARKIYPAYKGVLGPDNLLSTFRQYRNQGAHTDISLETLITMLSKVKDLDNLAEGLIQNAHHDSSKLIAFEKFSTLGTKTDRAKLVDALISKLNTAEQDDVSFPLSAPTRDYSLAIQEIIKHEDLKEISRNNQHISLQLTEDIILWATETKRKIAQNSAFIKEEELLNKCANQSPEKLFKSYPGIREFLKDVYIESELNLKFYLKEFIKYRIHKNAESQLRAQLSNLTKGKLSKGISLREFIKTDEYEKIKDEAGLSEANYDSYLATLEEKMSEKKSDLKVNFISNWTRALEAKRAKYDQEQIDIERNAFCKFLYTKVEKFNKIKKLLTPFTDDVKRLWDLSAGVWKETDLSIIEEYSVILENENSIRELAELLGKMRVAENEYEIERVTKTVIKQEYYIEYGYKSEMVGVHESNDINALVPSELCLLGNEETEMLFYHKLADNKLLTFQYQALLEKDVLVDEEVIEKREKRVKGPFIICVDTSTSMVGLPEQIAKILCLSLVKTAMREKRGCHLITFTDSVKTIDLSDISTSLDKMVIFLGTKFNGNTDANPALIESLNVLNREAFKNADVVVVSDFQMGDLGQDVLTDVRAQKLNGTRFNSLIISNKFEDQAATMSIFNDHWIYDTSDKNAMLKMVRDLDSINK